MESFNSEANIHKSSWESLQHFQMQGNNSIVLQKYYVFLEMAMESDFSSDLIGMSSPLLFHFAQYELNQIQGFQNRRMMH